MQSTLWQPALKQFVQVCASVHGHGLMVSCGGEVKANVMFAPFMEGQPHRMYSVSKTMTALAIGILIGDGRLALDDAIASYFPDYLPASPDPRLLRLTLRDMLRMATCYTKTTYREGVDENWASTFFTATPTHEPGTCFHYDTSCSQVLAALVTRRSGQQVLDFLNERLFVPLGLQDERFWLRDPSGCCQGGTGLCMSLRDLHRVALLVMRGGEGLVPAWFIEQMTQCQIDTSMKTTTEEERQGYGWQMWRHRRGWWMYGMGGQIAACWPVQQVLLCTVADTRLDPQGIHTIFSAFEELLLPIVSQAEGCAAWTEPPVRDELPADDVGLRHHWGRYTFQENPLGLTSLALDGETLRYTNARGACVLPLALRQQEEIAYPGWPEVSALVKGRWLAEDVLLLRCHAIGVAPCGFEMRLCFRPSCVTVQCRRSSDPITVGYDGVASGYRNG